MTIPVDLADVEPMDIAVVRQQAPLAMLSTVLMPAFDTVWAHLRAAHAQTGHNVIVFRGDATEFDMEIGVQVLSPLEPAGDVYLSRTPAGRAAHVLYVGSYDGLPEVHTTIQDWIDATPHRYAGVSWEVYGDWSEDPAKLETNVYYLLEPVPH